MVTFSSIRYAACCLVAAGMFASCGGSSQPILGPTAAMPSAGLRLYVAWNDGAANGHAQIRVYAAQLVSKPRLLETLHAPFGQVWGLATDAQGSLYAATCTQTCPTLCGAFVNSSKPGALTAEEAIIASRQSKASGTNGIAVYYKGTGQPSLDYLAPPGEEPLEVAVGSDGTVYSGNRSSTTCAAYPRLDVEVYAKGHEQPTSTTRVATGTRGLMGLALDAKNDIWVSYFHINDRIHIDEFTHGSSEVRRYTLPAAYCCADGGLTFDRAGHLVIGICLAQDSSLCGAAIMDVHTMKRVGFIQGACPVVSGFQICFGPQALAFSADEKQLWAALVFAEGYTYPQGTLRSDFRIRPGNKTDPTWGVAIGR